MNILFFHSLLIFAINLTGIYLCLLVYFSEQRKPLKRTFVYMMLSMFMWVDFAYLARVYGTSDYLPLLFLKIAWFITPIFFTLLYFFTMYLIEKVKECKKLNAAVIFIGSLLAIVCGLTDLVIGGLRYTDQGINIIYGVGKVPFFIAVFFLTCATLFPLLSQFRRISDKEKTKYQYFLIGMLIFYVANTIFNIILPAFLGIARLYYLGDYSTIFFLTLTAYAITKKRLMNVKVFVLQISIFLISLILVFDLIFLSSDIFIRFAKVVVLVTFLYSSREIMKSVRKEDEAKKKIEKANLGLRERNHDLRVLLDVGNTVSQNLDSRKISQDIVDSIPQNLKYLGYTFGVIVLYSEEKDCAYVYAVTDSPLARKIESSAKVQIGKFRERLSANNDLIVRTIKNKKIYTGDNMEYFFGGFMDEEKTSEVQRILEAKSFISIPLFSSGQVMGAIILSNEKSLNNMTERGKEIVGVFASHIGPSIENAQLYEKTDSQMKELSRLNLDLQKANVKLKELLEMKNDFLHITSHQLRTPLTAIRGMISMWIEGDFDKMSKEKRGEMLNRIYASAERLNNITNDMLDALELEGGVAEMKFQKVSVVKMINDTVNMLKPEFDKKGLHLRVNEIRGKVPEAEVDLNYMGQVFTNLIENACKYTPKGGVEIDIKTGSKNINITISDTGIGISPEDKEKIFDKFTRGKNAMEENISGSGLGLFVVKKILDEHNGKIEMKSAGVGKGTTFEISLPIKQEKK